MVTDALRCLPHVSDLDELAGLAVEALRQVNAELIELARAGDRDQTIGTTVVGLAIADGAYPLLLDGRQPGLPLRGGEIVRLSHDHSLVQNFVDAGMIKPEEAETHDNANLITRAVGVPRPSKWMWRAAKRGPAMSSCSRVTASPALSPTTRSPANHGAVRSTQSPTS